MLAARACALPRNAVRLELHGDIDVASVDIFREALYQQIHGSYRYIMLDLHEVRYMDSTAFAVLMSGMQALMGGRKMLLIGVSPALRRVFTVTGLSRLLELYDSEQAALEHLPLEQY